MTKKDSLHANSVVVYWHDDILAHNTGSGVFEDVPSPLLAFQEPHPENPTRILNIKSVLEKGPVSEHLLWKVGRHATESELLLFHTKTHLENVRSGDLSGPVRLDGAGTVVGPGSWNAALAAAGTGVVAMQDILDQQARIGYVLVRPPGHHAQPDLADGSCLFNNIGVAVNHALAQGLKRIAVIDWDQHHGNGTQEGFYDDDRVLTISLHMPHGSWGTNHPQSGAIEEVGRGHGTGCNMNIPLPYGAGDAAYSDAFRQVVIPVIDDFEPELIVIACGFDSNQFDPNGRSLVTMSGFNRLCQQSRALAEKHCDGRLLLFQEGGYAVTYTAFCAHAAMEGCLGRGSTLKDPAAYYDQPAPGDTRSPRDILDMWRQEVARSRKKYCGN
tara:strand:+ start:29937 stop:31091 length:1155 start_codon:yes stop_codon:yes gene_type:complete